MAATIFSINDGFEVANLLNQLNVKIKTEINSNLKNFSKEITFALLQFKRIDQLLNKKVKVFKNLRNSKKIEKSSNRWILNNSINL